MKVIIVSPSLDVNTNVSGISDVTNFIMSHNDSHHYIHFMQGKKDKERGGWYRFVRVIKNYMGWRNLLNNNKDALVHYNFPLSYLSIIRDYAFMRAVMKTHTPLVIHTHGGKYLFADQRPFILRFLLKRIFNWQCPFIVLSELEKNILANHFGVKNVRVLPNCIDLTDQAGYIKDNFDEPTLHLLYMGRIDKEKGIDYIRMAAKELKQCGINFLLHIAGQSQNNTDYISSFRNELGDNFVYEGVVADDKKKALLKKCHVFLLPTVHEGMPISLLEAMSYALVPVVTNVGSISEMVKDNVNGLFIENNSAKSIVKVVKALYADRKQMKRLGLSARQTTFEHFDNSKYLSELNSIYSSVNLNK